MGSDHTWSFTTKPDELKVAGIWISPDIWIRARINTEDQGEIEGQWRLGGEDRTEGPNYHH